MAKNSFKPPVAKSPVWFGDGNERRLVAWFLTLFITGAVIFLLFILF